MLIKSFLTDLDQAIREMGLPLRRHSAEGTNSVATAHYIATTPTDVPVRSWVKLIDGGSRVWGCVGGIGRKCHADVRELAQALAVDLNTKFVDARFTGTI